MVRIVCLSLVGLSLISCKVRDESGVKSDSTQAAPSNAAVDGLWGPIVTLRDRSEMFQGTHEIPQPTDGWWVSPIHVNLLADGRTLITGWSRPREESCADHQGRLNGTSFLLDPNDLKVDGPQTLAITPIDEKPKVPGDVLYCAGHAPLPDGRILFMGGARYKILGDVEYPPDFKQREYGLPYARMFDPKTNTFERVRDNNPGDPHPPQQIWTADGGESLPYEPGMMWYPTNTRIPGGKILTNGGFSRWVSVTDANKWSYLNKSVTVFDPIAFGQDQNPWSILVSHANAPREVGVDVFDYPRSMLLPKPVTIDGLPRQVAVFGGIGWDPQDPSYMPGITFLSLDPSVPESKRFATPANSRRPNGGMLHETTSTLLPSGEIMIAGGGKDADQDGQRLDVYNPYTDKWRTSIETGITRQKPASTLLPDGTVLILGGEESYQSDRIRGDRRQPAIYDPETSTISNLAPWTNDADMRGYHAVSLLMKDGSVLVGGGRIYAAGNEGKYRIGCERPELRLYQPPYLFKGPRPQFANVSSPVKIKVGGQAFTLHFNGPKPRSKGGVVLMALGAFTHSFDQNQRYVRLDFQDQGPGEISVTPPATTELAPEGEYNLFLVSEQGVPSTGMTARVE